MNNKTKIIVKEVSIRTLKVDGTDFISITDIAKQKNPVEPKDVVKNWMRLKNTLEYLGLWEQLNNPAFKRVDFDPLLKDAGSNAFTMSPSRWVEITGAIGMTAKEWRETNPNLNGNICDYGNINELICLTNMENLNAIFINEKMPQQERLVKLNQIAIQQMRILQEVENRKLLK